LLLIISMFLRNKTFILSIVFVAFFVSCNRKWKKTSETVIDIELIKSSSNVSHIEITEGTILINKFDFKGIRKQGEEVQFEDYFDKNNSEINVQSSTSPYLIYDIPQGTYTSITTKLRFDKKDSENSIIINGFFINSSKSSKVPFSLVIDDQLESETEGIGPTHSSEINIIAEIETKATISINIIDWFTLVPRSLLAGAERIKINGVSTILISKDKNEEIFALIIDKIGENDQLIFN